MVADGINVVDAAKGRGFALLPGAVVVGTSEGALTVTPGRVVGLSVGAGYFMARSHFIENICDNLALRSAGMLEYI